MSEPVAPRSVVLSLVRVAPERAVSVRLLIEAGRLFGLNANAIRVAVTRLVAQGLLESDERGRYRLGAAASAVTEHVEEWRRGEARVRPWRGEWLAVALPSGTSRSARRGTLSALTRLGMREGLPGLWVRPDNLVAGFDATLERLRALGLEDGAEPFIAHGFAPRLLARLREQLWPLRSLQKAYAESAQRLERSLPRLAEMPRETALVQSFLLGGEAIRVLATDPLLPDEISPSAPREKLHALMLRYDAVGHRLWSRYATTPELALVQGGRA